GVRSVQHRRFQASGQDRPAPQVAGERARIPRCYVITVTNGAGVTRYVADRVIGWTDHLPEALDCDTSEDTQLHVHNPHTPADERQRRPMWKVEVRTAVA